MAQFARPDTDASIGAYTDQAGGASNIYTTIDEAVTDDADYIKSAAGPANAPYVARLSDVTDPVSSTGHIIRARVRNGVAGARQIDLTVQLRQGYTNEGSPGTLIATLTQANVAGAFTEYTYTLSGAEADAITNYNDLFLRIVANQV